MYFKMTPPIKITNVNIYLANGHFQKNMFILIFFYQLGSTGMLKEHLSIGLPRPHNAPKASDYKETTCALEWLAAQSIILTEQMGGKLNI